MLKLAPIGSRNQLGELLTSLGLTGIGVEIGTHRGDYAEILLRTWSGKLLCIDPWENAPDYADQAATLWGGAKTREQDLEECRRRLAEWIEAGRCKLIRKRSPGASGEYKDDSLDFVYIDGDHRQQAVLSDIYAWWRKLRPGGLMVGHDFVMPGEIDGSWSRGVQDAVMTFCQWKGFDIAMIPEPDNLPWSWYIEKSKE